MTIPPGAPDYESTDVTLTLNTSLDTVQNGAIDITVPLIIKGGPRALVTLKANVIIPDILVGWCKFTPG
jgi:hydrocephalus-inducing protein